MLRYQLIAECVECANSRGRGKEQIDLMFIDNFPKAAAIGVGWHAFKDKRGCAVGERAVNDVRVARDPADIGCTPPNLAFFVIKHIFEGHCRLK